jgi:hypothetical protein
VLVVLDIKHLPARPTQVRAPAFRDIQETCPSGEDMFLFFSV